MRIAGVISVLWNTVGLRTYIEFPRIWQLSTLWGTLVWHLYVLSSFLSQSFCRIKSSLSSVFDASESQSSKKIHQSQFRNALLISPNIRLKGFFEKMSHHGKNNLMMFSKSKLPLLFHSLRMMILWDCRASPSLSIRKFTPCISLNFSPDMLCMWPAMRNSGWVKLLRQEKQSEFQLWTPAWDFYFSTMDFLVLTYPYVPHKGTLLALDKVTGNDMHIWWGLQSKHCFQATGLWRGI